MGSLRSWRVVVVAILVVLFVSPVASAGTRHRRAPRQPAKHHVVRHHTSHGKHPTAAHPGKHWRHSPAAKPKGHASGKWHRKDG